MTDWEVPWLGCGSPCVPLLDPPYLSGAGRQVKRALLDADVNLKVTNALIEAVKDKALGA